MSTSNILSITEARKRIFELADQVQIPGRYFTVTEKGRPKAVIMSSEEFESWQETLEVMKDFPDLDKDIEETNAAIKSGEYKKWTTLEEILAKEGFLISDKAKKKYGIQRKIKAKGRKSIK